MGAIPRDVRLIPILIFLNRLIPVTRLTGPRKIRAATRKKAKTNGVRSGGGSPDRRAREAPAAGRTSPKELRNCLFAQPLVDRENLGG
jgi:hypothetical protein